MKSTWAALFVAATFLIVTPLVSAQVVGAYYPLEVVPAPSVVVGESYVVRRPVITYWPVVEESHVVQRPIISYSPLVESPTVTVFRPSVIVGPRYVVPQTVYRVHTLAVVAYRPAYRSMVTTYRPMVTTYRPVGPAVVYPRSVVVRPKVYVRGQPVRNVLRAITP